ncbi:MAG TPA: glycosyltransferase [Pyrinomonadaceae bacterium]|nr:glycosyltransferase [Pyrinomonadaceae bacterium]
MSEKIQAVFYGNPDQYPPIINSAHLLARAGFELEIFCRGDDEEWNVSYPPTVKIHRLRTNADKPWLEYASFIANVLRRTTRDTGVFIGHDMHGLLPARVAGLRHGRPVVYHCHDFAENGRRLGLGSSVVRTFERCFARGSKLVVVPDADRALVVSKELHLRQAPLISANAPLARSAPNGEWLRQVLASQGRSFEAVVFRQGRVGNGHALETTLRSVPFWKNKNWGFVVMGVGEPDYVGSLNEKARALEVERQFVVLPPVGYDDVAQYTSGADLGHALYEPIHVNNAFIATASCKIMEYMEAGIPLLVSDTPALKNLVNKFECGVAADEKSPESIAAAVNLLLGEPEMARRMGAAARKGFEEEFCYDRQFAPVIDELRRLTTAENHSSGQLAKQT